MAAREDDEATLTYTIPMPIDGATTDSASVLDFVQSGPPSWKAAEAAMTTRPPGGCR